jgi:hypothetical protein
VRHARRAVRGSSTGEDLGNVVVRLTSYSWLEATCNSEG